MSKAKNYRVLKHGFAGYPVGTILPEAMIMTSAANLHVKQPSSDDESTFLRILRQSPFDATTRLVYADWLTDDGRDRWRDAALQRVLADPADDGLRLMFAECCEREGGADRGEFVRVQLEIARIRASGTADPARGVDPGTGKYTTPADFEKWKKLDARESELLNAHPDAYADKWFPVPEGYGLNWGIYRDPRGKTPLPQYYVIRRGFVESVTCSAADWFRHAEAILASQPVRPVRLTSEPTVPNYTVSTRMPHHAKIEVAGQVVVVDEQDLFASRFENRITPEEYIAREAWKKRWRAIAFEFQTDNSLPAFRRLREAFPNW